MSPLFNTNHHKSSHAHIFTLAALPSRKDKSSNDFAELEEMMPFPAFSVLARQSAASLVRPSGNQDRESSTT
jgi:hypothetical protein